MTKQQQIFQQPPISTCLEEVVEMKDAAGLLLLPNPDTRQVAPAPLKHYGADAYMQLRRCPNIDCKSYLVAMDRFKYGVNAFELCANRDVGEEFVKFIRQFEEMEL